MSNHANIVSDEYNRLHPDKTAAQRTRDIHKRCRISRGLFANLPVEEQESMQSAAEAEYEKDLEEFKQLQDSLMNVSPPTLQSQLRQVSLAPYMQSSIS